MKKSLRGLRNFTRLGNGESQKAMSLRDRSDMDTVVVPAHEEGFQKEFLNEDRFYAIKISPDMIPQIKYIAAYRVRPISAITHIAPVASIEPWRDTAKYVVNFAQPAKEIRPIPFKPGGKIKGFQVPRYTSKAKLETAQTLDDVF